MTLRRSGAAVAALALALLGACDGGSNPFNPGNGGGGGGGGGGGSDAAPSVEISLPAANATVAVGDSLFVRARVRDDRRLETVEFEGFAVRGDVNLGTDTTVVRFASKTVTLSPGSRVVTDTTLDRFLVATADTLREGGVFVVVTATDTAGNARADTVEVAVGGPRVQVAPVDGQTVLNAGQNLQLRVRADDPRDQIASVRVRGSGAFAFDRTITLNPTRGSIDTVLVIPVPQSATGTLQVTATTLSGSNQEGTSVPMSFTVNPAAIDTQAPLVTFQSSILERVEQQDSFTVSVSAVDDQSVDSVGVTVLAIRRATATPDTLRIYRGRTQAASATFRFSFADLGLSSVDTASVDLEVTGWATDLTGNCGASVSPNTPQRQACVSLPGGTRVGPTSGRVTRAFVARGVTVARPNGSDLIADLVADGRYVYLSNFTRNRVELLPLGGTAYQTPVRVGSQPWGLAIGRNGDSLYVANSGGTNISVISLSGVPSEAQDQRIFTQNERLFSVDYDALSGAVSVVTVFDYSDRPQFLAQASNGLLVYSTLPTAAAADGTVRIYDPKKLRSEIFIGYVDRNNAGKAIVVNADAAGFTPPTALTVCPRMRVGDTSSLPCITGPVQLVADSLDKLRAKAPNAQGGRYDTRVDIGADIEDVGFADTTFVAASTDRRFIAVGEGVRTNARIPLFEAVGEGLQLRGDVRDLISNSADRVIGLGLNRDGSLGVARGNEAYFFDEDLRRQGSLPVGVPAGGVALHPQGANYPNGSQRLGFVSGIENGVPFVDVVDAFSFERIKRIVTRDVVTGALAVAPRAPGDPANVNLRIYALTSGGVVGIAITNEDLTSPF